MAGRPARPSATEQYRLHCPHRCACGCFGHHGGPAPSCRGFCPHACAQAEQGVVRRSWCTGLMLRARPSCVEMAKAVRHNALVRMASVATTPMVVLVPARAGAAGAQQRAARVAGASHRRCVRPSPVRCRGRSRLRRCEAMRAPTVTPSTVMDAVPTPPFMACWMPKTLTTTAPAPAPTLPSAGSALDAAAHAACSPLPHRGECACRPPAGQTAPPRARWAAAHGHVQAHTALFPASAPHPWRLRGPGAAASEQPVDGVHLVHQVEGSRQQVGFAGRERRRARPPCHGPGAMMTTMRVGPAACLVKAGTCRPP